MVRKCIKYTITFGYDLSYSIQTLRVISYLKLHLDAENRGGTKRFEEVLDATCSADTACDDSFRVIPQHEGELIHKMVKNLRIKMSYGVHERTRASIPERRTSILPLPSYAREGDRIAPA